MKNIPRPGDIFYMAKDKPYQVITIGIHKETGEKMAVYQALFGDFKTYILPLSKFMNEIHENIAETEIRPDETENNAPFSVTDKNKGENGNINDALSIEKINNDELHGDIKADIKADGTVNGLDKVNAVLLGFLDADTFTKKLEIVTTHIKSIDNRMINDMAASLDCTIEDGPLEQRLQELIYCLKQMSRFEDRRLR